MEFLVGTVKDNSNYHDKKDGTMLVELVIDNELVQEDVTYTSPYYMVNGGGMVAIPEPETQILVLHNKNPKDGESSFYYHSCIVTDKGSKNNKDRKPNFQAIKDNDNKAKIYSKRDIPVTQAFTNTVGAGLYIQRDFDGISINNNVTVKAENGCEVTAGALGVQVFNNHGDSIVLTSDTNNDSLPARGLSVVTRGNQEYKCTNSDMTIKIVDGGDINIENNSTGSYGIQPPGTPGLALGNRLAGPAGVTPKSGNIRLKTRWRDIILAALGVSSKIHIVTNTSKIIVDGETGTVDILAPGGLNINSAGQITMNSGAGISLNAAGPISMNSTTTIENNAAVSLSNNSLNHFINDNRVTTINPQGLSQTALLPTFNITVPTPATTIDPVKFRDDYNDGFIGPGAT